MGIHDVEVSLPGFWLRHGANIVFELNINGGLLSH